MPTVVEPKKWYQSKTLWVNGVAILAIIIDNHFGLNITNENQVSILAVINLILRLFTKSSLKT